MKMSRHYNTIQRYIKEGKESKLNRSYFNELTYDELKQILDKCNYPAYIIDLIIRSNNENTNDIINYFVEKTDNWIILNNILETCSYNTHILNSILKKAVHDGQLNVIYKYIEKLDIDNRFTLLKESINHFETFKYISDQIIFTDNYYVQIVFECINKNAVNEITHILEHYNYYDNNDVEFLYKAYEKNNKNIIEIVIKYTNVYNQLLNCMVNKNSSIIINIFELIDNKEQVIDYLNTHAYLIVNVEFMQYLLTNNYLFTPERIYSSNNINLWFSYLENIIDKQKVIFQKRPRNYTGNNIYIHDVRQRYVGNNIITNFFKYWTQINITYRKYLNAKDMFLTYEKFDNGGDLLCSYFIERISYLKEIPEYAIKKIKNVPYGGTSHGYVKKVVPIPANYVILERYYECIDDIEDLSEIYEILKYYGILFKGNREELKVKIQDILSL